MMTTLLLWCITKLTRSRTFQYLMPEIHAGLYHLVYQHHIAQKNCYDDGSHSTLQAIHDTHSWRHCLKY